MWESQVMMCLVLNARVYSSGRSYKTRYVAEGSYDTVNRCACHSNPLLSSRQHLLSLATLKSRTTSNASEVAGTVQLLTIVAAH